MAKAGTTQQPSGRAQVKGQPSNRYSDVWSRKNARQANGNQNSAGSAINPSSYEYNRAYADDDSTQVNSEMTGSEAIQAFYGSKPK